MSLDKTASLIDHRVNKKMQIWNLNYCPLSCKFDKNNSNFFYVGLNYNGLVYDPIF